MAAAKGKLAKNLKRLNYRIRGWDATIANLGKHAKGTPPSAYRKPGSMKK